MSKTTGIELPKSVDLAVGADPAREREQVKTLAQEFEAMLMLQMIRGMRQSMLDEEAAPEGLGNDTLTDNFDLELSRHLSKAGGFGLGDWLARQIRTGADTQTEAPRDGGTAVEAPHMSAMSAMSTNRHNEPDVSRNVDTSVDTFRLSMPISGATTSAFGLRADPMNGRQTSHRGVDLRAAYGTEVPAAEAGTVGFAGERGAYGNLVILRHANGMETRYAHLSSIAVTQGASVAAGEPLGRVGSTGRSTAPHLHFEVLVDGERVDPERVAARVGRGPLKLASHADD